MNSKRVIVVIPIYREFQKTEEISFLQGITVLKDYTFNLLHPTSFSVQPILDRYGQSVCLTETALPDEHFKGVQSYNDLLLTEDFYKLYSEYEYMLIYQLDAYVFEDRLAEWLDKGYDYVGAPWIPTEFVLKTIFFMPYQKIRRLFPVDLYNIPHCFKYFAVGNGGFSLRRIETMRRIMADDAGIIRKCGCNEDVYISQIATRTHQIRIPGWREALGFSFEKSLKHSFRLNGNKLPFGCHYWSVPKRYDSFWYKFIPCS